MADDLQRRPDESQVEYDRRRAEARGRQARQAATSQQQPQNPDVVADRQRANFQGQRERSKAEMRGAMRRVSAQNRLAPPPASTKDSEAIQKIQNNSPIRRFFQAVDRVRKKDKQEGGN